MRTTDCDKGPKEIRVSERDGREEKESREPTSAYRGKRDG